MSCLTTQRKNELKAELESLEAQLASINTAISSGNLHVESATLDTGEGRQSMKYRSLDELIKTRQMVQSQINRLRNILRGTGLLNVGIRRKH